MWRRYDATELATPEAFEADPGLVVSLSSTYLVLGLCCREGTRGSISER
jgi:hypothetical protein